MSYFKSVQSLIHGYFASGPAPKPCAKDAGQGGKKTPLEKMRETQERFQQKDGRPIFLKCGMRDQILYRTTMVLAILGIFETFRMVYTMSVPPKPPAPAE